eukprot:459132-Prymnesium_polylepis.2
MADRVSLTRVSDTRCGCSVWGGPLGAPARQTGPHPRCQTSYVLQCTSRAARETSFLPARRDGGAAWDTHV